MTLSNLVDCCCVEFLGSNGSHIDNDVSGVSADGLCVNQMDGWEAQFVPQIHGGILCWPVIWFFWFAWVAPSTREPIRLQTILANALQNPPLIWPGLNPPSSLYGFKFLSLLSVSLLIFFPLPQFKVLRGGFWQRVNFERARKQMSKEGGSHTLLANPWIQHFRSECKDEAAVSPTLQENGASTSKAVPSRGKKALPCGLPTTSKQFPMYHFNLCQRDSVANTAGSPQLNIFVFWNILLFLLCMRRHTYTHTSCIYDSYIIPAWYL